jgi:hypothetical protein
VSLAGVFWNGTDNATSCGVDPLRKLFVRTGNAAVPFVYWDLSTPGSGNRDVRVTPTDPSGEFPTLLASGNVTLPNCGFDFDARRNRFALWCGDGRVWMLTPPATASPLGWTIQKQRAPTRAIPNGDVGTGILGKWKYIPNLDAFIGLQDYTLGNIWIYKPVGWVNPQQPLALAAPTSVNASDGTSTANVAVTWKAVSGATSYSVYRSTTAGSQGTLLGSTASLSLLDSSATAGVTYFYGVTASGGGSTSALSAQDSGFRRRGAELQPQRGAGRQRRRGTASSTNGPGFPPGATIDNQRSGAGWGAGGGWNDASFGQFPDWLQVTFSSLRSIDRVVVYSVQDNYLSPVEPSDTMTFTLRGISDFTVQGLRRNELGDARERDRQPAGQAQRGVHALHDRSHSHQHRQRERQRLVAPDRSRSVVVVGQPDSRVERRAGIERWRRDGVVDERTGLLARHGDRQRAVRCGLGCRRWLERRDARRVPGLDSGELHRHANDRPRRRLLGAGQLPDAGRADEYDDVLVARHQRFQRPGLQRLDLGDAGNDQRQSTRQTQRDVPTVRHRSHSRQHRQRARQQLVARDGSRGVGTLTPPTCRVKPRKPSSGTSQRRSFTGHFRSAKTVIRSSRKTGAPSFASMAGMQPRRSGHGGAGLAATSREFAWTIR